MVSGGAGAASAYNGTGPGAASGGKRRDHSRAGALRTASLRRILHARPPRPVWRLAVPQIRARAIAVTAAKSDPDTQKIGDIFWRSSDTHPARPPGSAAARLRGGRERGGILGKPLRLAHLLRQASRQNLTQRRGFELRQ